MQTIGLLLQSLRLKKNLTLEHVSNQTNIATYLLEALEADDFTKLPASTFTKGFITSYAKVVGLSPQRALAIFRRDFAIGQSGKIMPKGLAKPLDKETVVTSKWLVVLGIVILLLGFGGYIFFQLRNYSLPPSIDMIRPKPNTVVKGPIVPVKGFVSADSSVYVNSQVIEVFPTGEFQATVQLSPGNQTITVKAIDSNSKQSELLIPVYVVDK